MLCTDRKLRETEHVSSLLGWRCSERPAIFGQALQCIFQYDLLSLGDINVLISDILSKFGNLRSLVVLETMHSSYLLSF